MLNYNSRKCYSATTTIGMSVTGPNIIHTQTPSNRENILYKILQNNWHHFLYDLSSVY